jgi:periplasmic protein TonB
MADIAANEAGLPRGDSRSSSMRSRGGAAAFAAVLHAVALYLLVMGFGRPPPPPAVAEHPMQVFLFDRPRAAHPASELASARPARPVPQFNWEEVPVPEISMPAEPVAAEPAKAVTAATAGGPQRADAAPGDSDGLDVSHRVEPIYPAQSSRAHEEGTTVVAVLIGPAGHPEQVKVLRSSGFARLDDAAVHAIRQWTFVPRKDAAPEDWAQVQVGFHLHRFDRSLRLAGIHLTLLAFDPALAGEFEAIAPRVAGESPKPSTEYRLRGLIERLCAMYSKEAFPASSQGAKAPLAALAGGGALQQVRFMGLAPHALDVDDFRHSQEVRWDLYRAIQERATSQWLVGVDADGMIKSVQMMADR